MHTKNKRKIWNTNTKIYFINGLHLNLPKHIIKEIGYSNIYRWRKESIEKYQNNVLQHYISKDIDLIHWQNEYPSSKKLAVDYIKLLKGVHEIFDTIKDFDKAIKSNKEIVINTIESIKDFIPVASAIKLFRISRATYQNYKVQVLNKCDASYMYWCVKRYPQQLINNEIKKIKSYFLNPDYQYWSKASLYYVGLRNKDFSFSLATFYKYAKLLGFNERRGKYPKQKYSSLKSHKPNQIWCADVTIHKTKDGAKHYIHVLMDHYSKMILGWKVASSSQPKIIKELLENAFTDTANSEKIQFVTDAGIENVNKTVRDYILGTGHKIIHTIAQKDIKESNSVVEAFHKVIKNQFIRPYEPENGIRLQKILENSIPIYCYKRPQHNLRGNTPFETQNGKPILYTQYNAHFKAQKELRKAQNHLNRCKKCVN